MGKKKKRNPNQPSLFPEWERVQDQLKKEHERSGFVPHHKKLFISFSGGKDSVATYILARQLYKPEQIELVFTDTADESPECYDYCRWFNKHVFPITRMATKIEGRNNKGRILRSVVIDWSLTQKNVIANYHTVYDEVRERHRSNPNVPPFPDYKNRHCTKTMKILCFERYVKTFYPNRENRGGICVAIGLRRLESDNRKNTPYFAFDLDNGWDIWYPVFDYTTAEVFELHLRNSIKISPVYEYRERSGCVGCALAPITEVQASVRRHGVAIIQHWIDLENETGYTYKNGISILEAANEATHENEVETAISCTSGFCEVI